MIPQNRRIRGNYINSSKNLYIIERTLTEQKIWNIENQQRTFENICWLFEVEYPMCSCWNVYLNCMEWGKDSNI